MKKIFISHKQDYAPAKEIKSLINMFGVQGVLVEEEPGADAPEDRAKRLLGESDGFLAICTPDERDATGQLSPNIAVEIQIWQVKHKNSKMVIMKHKNCKIPTMVGNLTYIEFEGEGIARAILKMLQHFQEMKVIPYSGQSV